MIEAYSNHYRLHIRPGDVWFAIIAAEFLHQPTRRRTTGKVCRLWSKKWARKVHLRKSLNSWFWTYDRNFNGWDWKWCCRFRVERVVQNTLTTKIVIRCGLLSVTLLGESAYWALILTRLDKLTIFGVETAQFATLFEPVISRFVQTSMWESIFIF